MVLVSAYLFAAENSPLQLGVAAAISTATAASSPQLLALKKFSTCFSVCFDASAQRIKAIYSLKTSLF